MIGKNEKTAAILGTITCKLVDSMWCLILSHIDPLTYWTGAKVTHLDAAGY